MSVGAPGQVSQPPRQEGLRRPWPNKITRNGPPVANGAILAIGRRRIEDNRFVGVRAVEAVLAPVARPVDAPLKEDIRRDRHVGNEPKPSLKGARTQWPLGRLADIDDWRVRARAAESLPSPQFCPGEKRKVQADRLPVRPGARPTHDLVVDRDLLHLDDGAGKQVHDFDIGSVCERRQQLWGRHLFGRGRDYDMGGWTDSYGLVCFPDAAQPGRVLPWGGLQLLSHKKC